jgi:Flp pilus assembly CpaF family ATPase
VPDVSIVELVRNGTMSAEMAAVLWAAVDEPVSFLTAAMPRMAGKSTTSGAALALRRPDLPLRLVTGEPEEMTRLERERAGGYLQIEEISRGRRGTYIWGEEVQRVFRAQRAGYFLQASLHAPDVTEAVRIVAVENGVGDELTAALKLVLIIERLGEEETGFWRRLAELYELHGVEGGRPVGQTLFRWRAEDDRFEQIAAPEQFGRDRADLARRADTIAGLAATGRTSPEEVAAAVAAYRAGA